MIIDTSAVIAILLDEPEKNRFSRLITNSSKRSMSVVSKFEAGMVATGRGGEPLMSKLTQVLRELDIAYVPFDDHQADIAREAFARYGKGRHRAGLNFGDCAAYALSIAEAEPLLFKGTDFGATDVQIVPLS